MSVAGVVPDAAAHGEARTDILISFAGDVTVGIEAKISYEITNSQLMREQLVCDHLLLLVPDVDVVHDEVPDGVDVDSWTNLLRVFPGSRLVESDIAAAREPVHSLPDGWNASEQAGQGGFPSLVIDLSEVAPGVSLIAQIQALRGDKGYFQSSIGVAVDDRDLDVDADVEDPPRWLVSLKEVGERVERVATEHGLPILEGAAPRTRNGVPRRSAQLAERFGLPLKWVKGYETSYLGFKTLRSLDAGKQALCALALMESMADELVDRADTRDVDMP